MPHDGQEHADRRDSQDGKIFEESRCDHKSTVKLTKSLLTKHHQHPLLLAPEKKSPSHETGTSPDAGWGKDSPPAPSISPNASNSAIPENSLMILTINLPAAI